jgi:hypothetical protein
MERKAISLLLIIPFFMLSPLREASARGKFFLVCKVGYKPTATISDLDNPAYVSQPELYDILPLEFSAGYFWGELFNTQLKLSRLSKTDRSLSRQKTTIRNLGLSVHASLYWPLTDSGKWILSLFGGLTFGWGKVEYSTRSSFDQTRGEAFGLSGGFGSDYYLSGHLFLSSNFNYTVLNIPTEGHFGTGATLTKVDVDLTGPGLDLGLGWRF